MAAQSISVSGLRELQQALEEMNLSKATTRNVLRRSLLQVAEMMVTAAQANAPVNTGWLRDDIEAGTKLSGAQAKSAREEAGTQAQAQAGGGFRSAKSDTLWVYVGPRTTAKAIVQEFGSRDQPAHPYMRPAWDQTNRDMATGIKDALAAQIEKAAQRAARKAARAGKGD